MSLKVIDLQMAIHRNDEAGVRQNQMTHKPQVDQIGLGQEATKQIERAREQTAKLEHSAEMHVQTGGKQADEQERKQRRRKSEHEEETSVESKTPPHPYKGHFLDLSL